MLTPEQISEGWLPHDGRAGSPPTDWDGGKTIMSDGTAKSPVGHEWVPFGEAHVIAYRPVQP